MAKQVNVVLKLKDEFTSKMKGAKSELNDFNRSFTRTNASLKKAAKQFTKTGDSVTKFGNKLTNSITKPALGAVTALAGVALAKGWARMQSLDEARAKLTALGNDTESVAKIMEDAQSSVKGTAFGMDEAATTAASAVAAGIKPGKDLASYLTSVADAASIAGVDMADMGAIFNKIATSNKIQAEEINQLQDKGLPITQYLAKAMGTTADKVKDLASEGKIDLKTFRKAVEDNLGGAAQTMGSSTISAALKNTWASVGRIGANFLGASDDKNSFAGQLLPLINELKNKLGEIEPIAKEWGKTFGELFTKAVNKVKELIAKIKELSPQTKKMIKVGALIAVGLGPAITIIGKVIAGVGTAINIFIKLKKAIGTVSTVFKIIGVGAGGWIGIAVAAVVGLVAVFKNLYENCEPFRNFVDETFPKLAQVMTDKVFPAFNTVKDVIVNMVEKIKEFVEKIKEIKENSEFLSFIGLNGQEAKSDARGNFANNITTRNSQQAGNKATGTSYFKGGPTHVNEGGRGELINLPSGTQIVPASKVNQSGTNISVNVTVQGNMIGDNAAMEKFAEYTGRKILSAMGNV